MPDNYEEAFWEEIWGCVNYIKIPYETVMNKPVRERKIWIQRHNLEQQRLRDNDSSGNGRTSEMSGEALNRYASLEQKKAENGVFNQ